MPNDKLWPTILDNPQISSSACSKRAQHHRSSGQGQRLRTTDKIDRTWTPPLSCFPTTLQMDSPSAKASIAAASKPQVYQARWPRQAIFTPGDNLNELLDQ
jgi:hypothetical protein